MKLSIDLANGNQEMVPSEHLVAAVTGVREGLNELGPLAEVITQVEVSFKRGTGFMLSMHFDDSLGRVCKHETDYRFIGNGGLYPSAEEIIESFKDKRNFVRAFIKSSPERIGIVTRWLDRMLAS